MNRACDLRPGWGPETTPRIIKTAPEKLIRMPGVLAEGRSLPNAIQSQRPPRVHPKNLERPLSFIEG